MRFWNWVAEVYNSGILTRRCGWYRRALLLQAPRLGLCQIRRESGISAVQRQFYSFTVYFDADTLPLLLLFVQLQRYGFRQNGAQARKIAFQV